MISIIIPAYEEIYLEKTINSAFDNAKEEVEVIVVLDGYWPNPITPTRKSLKIIHFGSRRGMRACINAGVRIASGKYIMKLDAHCLLDKGFDVKLKSRCEHNWVVVPQRYRLNVDKWTKKGSPREFQYIEKDTLKGRDWPEYAKRAEGLQIVDLMTTQGSCWFMHKEYFESIGCLDEDNYGGMGREAQEVCLKTWTSGGRFVLNRNTWYAHWDKPKEHVVKRRSDKLKSEEYAKTYWTDKVQSVVNRFAPVPTW